MPKSHHLDSAARAASYNVLLQVTLRASSFVLNGFVLRFIQAELLGVVNLRYIGGRGLGHFGHKLI